MKTFDYIHDFYKVILWGAGNLGKAVGKKLSKLGIEYVYWDQCFEQISQVEGVKVCKPFSEDCGDGVLLIFCISNGVVVPKLLPKLKDAKHVLMGVEFYQQEICPHQKHGKFIPGECTESICNIRMCDELDSLLCPVGAELQLPVIGFIVNQKCTLKCKNCSAFMNHYPENERINFPKKRIYKDIEMMMEAVDSSRQVTVYGGEPFLHPDLHEIIRHILTYKNFANLSINTNAVCKLDPKILDIKDSRFSISISNYSENLSAAQQKKFNDNLSTIENSGVRFRNTKPQWMIPSTFDDKKRSIQAMEKMTAKCKSMAMCTEVKNGKFYPCAFICAIHALCKYDFESDYVDIDQACENILELRKELQRCMNRSYYRSCSICNSGSAIISAGEQVTAEKA
ncbi:MAG: radical SAM protein [Candidatus Heimdallarchaeota archaeon]|nr:radical SAM protein [Candidatus Heimdallarchaeota archaeon]